MQIKFSQVGKDQLIELADSAGIMLEGNILKVIDAEEDVDFSEYLRKAIEKDQTTRKKRLKITKQIQNQNRELIEWKNENQRIQEQLLASLNETQLARDEAESAKIEALRLKDEADSLRAAAEQKKTEAEENLELVQRKKQFEMMGVIVRTALVIIGSVGIIVTGMYIVSLALNKDTQIIGSTWSNIIGILLTNAFSIVGTIMGVRYASGKSE